MKEKEEDKFKDLQLELHAYKKALARASEIIIEKDVSKYPIFVFHQMDIEVGIPIIEKEKTNGNWNVNASSLEEFSSKSLINEDKVEEFMSVYKDPTTHFCLFVLSDLGAQFIFLEIE